MASTWLINGIDALVDPNDRGLAYGDGLFETMALVDGEISRFDRHLTRLLDGCRRLSIAAPDAGEILEDFKRLAPQDGRHIAKLIVTRGTAGRGYLPSDSVLSTRLAGIHPWPHYPDDYYTDGVMAGYCELRLGVNPALAGIKHLNRLEQVLARRELVPRAINEGLLLDTSGFVVGGTMSNVFAVQGDTLRTPDLRRCGVAGVMRDCVLEQAEKLGMAVDVTDLSPQEFETSDEIFLTNAIFGIWPLRQLEQRAYPPGPWTRALMRTLAETVDV